MKTLNKPLLLFQQKEIHKFETCLKDIQVVFVGRHFDFQLPKDLRLVELLDKDGRLVKTHALLKCL